MKFRCFGIEWDDETEDGIKAEGLPSEVIIELDPEDCEWAKREGDGIIDDLIVNELSKRTGWLVKHFEFEEVK